MIEILEGIHETVNYKGNTRLRLYNNTEPENYPAHWHIPLEIIMPTRNSYEVTIGKQTFHLQVGDIIFIGSGVIHSLQAPCEGIRLILQADVSFFYQFHELETLFGIIYPVLTVTPENAPLIYTDIRQNLLDIAEEYFSERAMSEAAIYSRLMCITVLLGRNHTDCHVSFDAENQKQKEYTDKFIHICHYIGEHCTEDLTLDEIANLAGFSKYHFTRLFKQFTNTTFYKYLNQKRISHAELLLTNPSISVTEVALQSGFSSLSAFIRMFKQIKLCTPTEFRNMYGNI